MIVANWHIVFSYADGELLWKAGKQGRGCVAGRCAGTKTIRGYVAVTVDGKKHYAHRIIWEMFNGQINNGLCIDHIDGNGSNNRIENLRLVSLSQNQRNAKTPKNCRLGIIGVYPKANGFAVQCAGEYIGFYGDFFQACCARKSAEIGNHFHENHGRKMK